MGSALTPPYGFAATRRAGHDDHTGGRSGAGSAGASGSEHADRFHAARARAEDQQPRPVGVEATGALVAAVLLWAVQLLPVVLIELATGGLRGSGMLESAYLSLNSVLFFESPVWVVAPAATMVALFAVRQLRPRPIEGQLFLLPVLAIVVYGVAGEIALNVIDPGISLSGPFFIMMTTFFGAPILVLLTAIAYTMWSTAPQRARRGRHAAAGR